MSDQQKNQDQRNLTNSQSELVIQFPRQVTVYLSGDLAYEIADQLGIDLTADLEADCDTIYVLK